MNPLLTQEALDFLASCEVDVTEHPDLDAAKAFIARVLAGDNLELAP